MDLANMLSSEPPRPIRSQHSSDHQAPDQQRSHQYPTRHSFNANMGGMELQDQQPSNSKNGHEECSPSAAGYRPQDQGRPPKNVAFELIVDEITKDKARLPMRVQIFEHDPTEYIVTAVKDFFGLYVGISFEDERGNILIAHYENFRNGMIVSVRAQPAYARPWNPAASAGCDPTPNSAQRMHRVDGSLNMLPPQPAQILTYGQSLSRPLSRAARRLSASPGTGGDRRGVSGHNPRARAGPRSREESFQTLLDERNNDMPREYSSSDGEGGSVTSSRKARNELLASAEISLENIVEGGRRQRLKFESSELPLYVPPQVPAANSISSISPQRRSTGQDYASPFVRPAQRLSNHVPYLPSPQSLSTRENSRMLLGSNNSTEINSANAPHTHRLRDRVTVPGPLTRLSTGMQRFPGPGILPTPDPTIASCISDEDVALQLMRLGDASNFSTHGRTSASTQDDTLSGRADIASSVTSDSEEEGEDTFFMSKNGPSAHADHTRARHVGAHAGNAAGEVSDDEDAEYYEDRADSRNHPAHPPKRAKLSSNKGFSLSGLKMRQPSTGKKSNKAPRLQDKILKKAKVSGLPSTGVTDMSPPTMLPPSRKASSGSLASGATPLLPEDDLSSKPRCQRCRKSKKGCDRQRPCQRCKDAGIGIEGCVSEDEGNGRKGRYGRHMGVSLKKEPMSPDFIVGSEGLDTAIDADGAAHEKSKKRKRV